jgi:hypothetical protein
MKVWHRKGDRTVLLLAGMATIVAGTLVLVVLLTGTADERGQAIALHASADAGVMTIPGGSQPGSRELGPPPGREGRSDDVARSAGRNAAGDGRESGGGSDGAGDSTGAGGSSSSDPVGDLPAPVGETGGSEGRSGDTSVSVGEIEITVDPDDTSATVTVGDTEMTVDPRVSYLEERLRAATAASG